MRATPYIIRYSPGSRNRTTPGCLVISARVSGGAYQPFPPAACPNSAAASFAVIQEEKKASKVVWVFAIIGIIAAVAAAVYGIYRFFAPDYLEDFEDDFEDDFDDDFFEDEEDDDKAEEPAEDKTEE